MKFNLSLDDYSPHPKTNNLYWVNKLIDKYPNIKIDLFVPAAYSRLNEKTYPFFLHRHLDWVEATKQLPNNYKINLHGLFHRRSKLDFEWHSGIESNNNEWENLTYKQAEFLLNSIEDIFKKANIQFSNVFRPPGWHIGREAAKLLIDRGYKIAGNNTYYKKLKDIPNLKWVSYNWDLLTKPPEGNIFCYGHTSNWTTNYFNEERYNTVINFLKNKEFDFKFIEDI